MSSVEPSEELSDEPLEESSDESLEESSDESLEESSDESLEESWVEPSETLSVKPSETLWVTGARVGVGEAVAPCSSGGIGTNDGMSVDRVPPFVSGAGDCKSSGSEPSETADRVGVSDGVRTEPSTRKVSLRAEGCVQLVDNNVYPTRAYCNICSTTPSISASAYPTTDPRIDRTSRQLRPPRQS